MKMKVSNILNKIKENKDLICISAIAVIVYSIILGTSGAFGDTIQSAFLFFVTKILPYIGMTVGYFLVVFIPIRIYQAIARNRKLKLEQEAEKRLQSHAMSEKDLQEKISNILTSEDTYE